MRNRRPTPSAPSHKAGYDPQELADFFRKLAAQGGQPPQLLSDHPNPGNREQAIEKEIRFWPPKDYQTNTAAFQRVQQQSASVRTYTTEEIAQGAKSGQWAALNQKNGAVFKELNASPTPVTASRLQSVLPSQRLITADLGRMTIVRPDNWQIKLPEREGDFLTIAPPNGVTSGHIGYGVLINGVVPPNGQTSNIDELTDQLVQQLVKSNAYNSPVGRSQSQLAVSRDAPSPCNLPRPFPTLTASSRQNAIGWSLFRNGWLLHLLCLCCA
jgi:hypothetical protein